MFTPHDDHRQWAKDQLADARTPQNISSFALSLLDAWWTMNHDQASAQATLDAFNALAMGHALVDPEDDAVYEDVRPGNISRGDRVRIKPSHYSGPTGEAHNARAGKVIGIRSGDIIIRYTDGKHPPGDGVHHSPYALQKRVN